MRFDPDAIARAIDRERANLDEKHARREKRRAAGRMRVAELTRAIAFWAKRTGVRVSVQADGSALVEGLGFFRRYSSLDELERVAL